MRTGPPSTRDVGEDHPLVDVDLHARAPMYSRVVLADLNVCPGASEVSRSTSRSAP
jgi:hypothetical protein